MGLLGLQHIPLLLTGPSLSTDLERGAADTDELTVIVHVSTLVLIFATHVIPSEPGNSLWTQPRRQLSGGMVFLYW